MILGIIGMAALPTITGFLGETQLNAACRVMVAGLEYAANLSVHHQRPFTFSTDLGLTRFYIKDTAPFPDSTDSIRKGNIPPVNADDVVFNPISRGWYEVSLTEIVWLEGIRITSAPGTLTFYPDGHSSYFDSQFVLSLGPATQTVSVDGISGKIQVE